MINLGTTFSPDDSWLIRLEERLVSLDGYRDDLFSKSGFELSCIGSRNASLINDSRVGVISGVDRVIINVAGASGGNSSSWSVGICSASCDTMSVGVFPCIVVPSTVTAIIFVTLRTRNEFLLRKLRVDRSGRLTLSPDEAQILSSWKGPAWSALSLIQHRRKPIVSYPRETLRYVNDW